MSTKIEEAYTFEDLENYGKRLHISTVLVLLFNIFTGYIVLKHSTESMGKYKYYILLTVISAALMDLDATLIFGIYPTFPLPGFCGAGVVAKHLNWFWGEVIQYIVEAYSSEKPSEITYSEREVADSIIYQINEIVNKQLCIETLEEGESLIIDHCDEYEEDEETDDYYKHLNSEDDDSDDDQKTENDPDYEEPNEKKARREVTPEEIEKALAYYKEPQAGSRPVSSMKKMFWFIRSRSDINNILLRYEKTHKPNRIQTLKQIDKEVNKIFIQKFLDGLPIHDSDIRMWAVKINNELETPLKDFKCSPHWIKNFKNRRHFIEQLNGMFRIKNRKYTHQISRTQISNPKKICQNATAFVADIKNKIKEMNLSESMVFNCDQSGFKKELHSQYTLAPEGIKKVTLAPQSSSATTHSYTVMPVLGMDGNYLPVLYLLIQEKTGRFPPTKAIPKPQNIYAAAGKSSIMSESEMTNFLKNVYFKNTGSQTMLIADSWNLWKKKDVIGEATPQEKHFILELIPPHATSLVQPLDVGVFKMWKQFDRKICDYGLLHNYQIKLHKRDSIINRQSFIHYQFSAPKFIEFNKKAWFNSGYIDKRPDDCPTPAEYCFNVKTHACEFSSCKNLSFSRCARCENYFCYDHCIINLHFCD